MVQKDKICWAVRRKEPKDQQELPNGQHWPFLSVRLKEAEASVSLESSQSPTSAVPPASDLEQCGLRINPQLQLLTQTLAVSVLLSGLWVLCAVLNQTWVWERPRP